MPKPGIILYKFTPPADSWTGTYFEHPLLGEITDAYDVHVWITYAAYPGKAYAYKQATNIGPVHRIRCSFSLNTMPDAGDHTDILRLTYRDTLGNPWLWYGWGMELYIMPNGTLGFNPDGAVFSANAISTGSSYNLEVMVNNDIDEKGCLWQVYINGDLWLEDTTIAYSTNRERVYAQFMAGFSAYTGGPGTLGPCDITLHIQNIIWTIEQRGFAHWTMFAVL